MNLKRPIRAGVLVVTLLAAAQLPAAGQTRADLEKGKVLFDGMCSRCHGYEGAGADGPSLNRPTLTRAQDDESFRAIIRDGIPERGMPRVRRTTDNEQQQLIAYVRSLSRTAPARVPGNVGNGKAIYQKSGCASCHIINGEGGATGPELTAVGAVRGPEYLRQALLDPGSLLPRGSPVPARNLDEFLPVRVVTREGREARGLRINEDSFTIQLRDANNQFQSFRKAELKELQKEFGKSLMPAYKERLTAPEVDDLVAWLFSLGGAK
jgi:putative heme-binding domain-containing protein